MSGWIVKFDGPCSSCGTTLRAGEVAVWDNHRRRMSCVECPPVPTQAPSPTPIDLGTAGASARREYERRQAKREAELKDRWGGRVGGWINRFAAEPQAIRAWGLGARGEEMLAAALRGVIGLIVLNDRRVPGTRGNIDHIAIAPAGVFVIDAKHYEGIVEVRDYGGFFRTDLRLTVGRRNKSHLAANMDWQVDAVVDALADLDRDVPIEVAPILCFVDAEWPLFRPPTEFSNVWIESERSIRRRLSQPIVHTNDEIQELAQVLAAAFPPK